MKWIYIVLCLVSITSYSQRMDTVYVSNEFSTIVEFSSRVLFVQIGNEEFKNGIENNLVMLQAKREVAKRTSLMIKTQDKAYVYIISYSRIPKKLHYKPDDQPSIPSNVATNKNSNNDSNVIAVSNQVIKKTNTDDNQPVNQGTKNYETSAPPDRVAKLDKILNDKRSIRDIGVKVSGIYTWVNDLYVDDEFLYVSISMLNTTQVAYLLDLISITYDIKNGSNKTNQARLGGTFVPTYYKSVKSISSGEEVKLVYAYPLLALKVSDLVIMKVNELGGYRSLEFEFKGELLNKSKRI